MIYAHVRGSICDGDVLLLARQKSVYVFALSVMCAVVFALLPLGFSHSLEVGAELTTWLLVMLTYVYCRRLVLFGWVICLVTRSEYVHAALVFWRDDGQPWVYEATAGEGFRREPLDEYLPQCLTDGYRVDWLMLVDRRIDRPRIRQTAEELLGTPYASPEQFLSSWGWIGSSIRRTFRMPADLDPKRGFCSERVAECHRAGGFQPSKSPALIAPGEVIHWPHLQLVGPIEIPAGIPAT